MYLKCSVGKLSVCLVSNVMTLVPFNLNILNLQGVDRIDRGNEILFLHINYWKDLTFMVRTLRPGSSEYGYPINIQSLSLWNDYIHQLQALSWVCLIWGTVYTLYKQ